MPEKAPGLSAKLLKYAMEGFLSFTTFPLRLATYLGAGTSFIAIIYLIVVIIQKLTHHIAVPGYATIVVLILLMGGIQLIILGRNRRISGQNLYREQKRPICIEKEYITYEEKE